MGCLCTKEQDALESVRLEWSGKEVIFHEQSDLLLKAVEAGPPPSSVILMPPAPLNFLLSVSLCPVEEKSEPVIESSREGCVASGILQGVDEEFESKFLKPSSVHQATENEISDSPSKDTIAALKTGSVIYAPIVQKTAQAQKAISVSEPLRVQSSREAFQKSLAPRLVSNNWRSFLSPERGTCFQEWQAFKQAEIRTDADASSDVQPMLSREDVFASAIQQVCPTDAVLIQTFQSVKKAVCLPPSLASLKATAPPVQLTLHGSSQSWDPGKWKLDYEPPPGPGKIIGALQDPGAVMGWCSKTAFQAGTVFCGRSKGEKENNFKGVAIPPQQQIKATLAAIPQGYTALLPCANSVCFGLNVVPGITYASKTSLQATWLIGETE